MRRFVVASLIALICSTPATLAADCGLTNVSDRFPNNGDGVPIALSPAADALLFKLRPNQMSLDLDGHPRTYGVRDQGIDGICNGLSALNPSACAGEIPRGACFTACQQALRDWNGSPADATRRFCSIGLGSGCGSTFKAPRQAPPNDGFFVSATSTKYARPPNAPPNWTETQAAQLDSLTVPFFVLPPAMRKLPFDASPGDVGVMIRTDQSKPHAFFIIGDSGNNGEIGESSARLHQLLSSTGTLPVEEAASAFGEKVKRLTVNGSPAVAVAIFRHSSKRPNGTGTSIDLTPDTIINWISTTGAARLNKLGGAETLLRCAPGQ